MESPGFPGGTSALRGRFRPSTLIGAALLTIGLSASFFVSAGGAAVQPSPPVQYGVHPAVEALQYGHHVAP